MTHIDKNLIRRFMKKVKLTPTCWEWQATRHREGYGQFYLKPMNQLAHRISYRIFIGTIPNGIVIDHKCSNKWCVNPAHLEAVSQSVNTQRHYDRKDGILGTIL